MIKNYIKVTWRNFWRQKEYSLLNIVGLTIGLTSVILIMLYVFDEFSYDKFHKNSERIFRVVENQYYAGQPVFPVAVTPAPLAPSLADEFPEVEKATRYWGTQQSFEYGNQKFTETGGYVDESFFDVFSFELIHGSATSALKELDNIIITQRMAIKCFGDVDPIDKVLTFGMDREVRVSGVLKDVPENSHLQFDFLIPIENAFARNPDRRNNWGSNSMYTYVLLYPDAVVGKLDEQIKDHIKRNAEGTVTEIFLQPLTDIHLGDTFFTADVSGKGNKNYVSIFSIIAIFILAIACINFMNLATARSMNRAKEVSVRKSIGASRSQLTFQFLNESVLNALLAMALAILLVDLLLPEFNLLSGKNLTFDLLRDNLFFYLLGFAVITGLVAGSYPALFLSSFQPAHILKSTLPQAGGSFFRKILVVTQFCISTVMITATLVVYNQIEFIRNKNLGYDRENIVKIPGISANYSAFRNELIMQAGIVNVSSSNQHPAYVENSTSGIEWEGKNKDDVILMHLLLTDFDFIETMDMEILSGRGFLRNNPSDSTGVVINEEALRVMGFENPIGQKLEVGAPVPYTIIGVVRDFHFKSIHQKIEPLVMGISFNERLLEYTMVRIAEGNPTSAITTIKKVWDKLNPGQEFVYTFLNDDFDELYSAEERTGTIFKYFSGLAVLVSCLGLFGLASFTLEQRTKEFGVRKVFGASILQLFSIASIRFVVLVVIAITIAVPISMFFITQWLNGFAYHITLGVSSFLYSGFIALGIAFATVSFQSFKSARLNPVESLRHE